MNVYFRDRWGYITVETDLTHPKYPVYLQDYLNSQEDCIPIYTHVSVDVDDFNDRVAKLYH
jgi:hypothetical protein